MRAKVLSFFVFLFIVIATTFTYHYWSNNLNSVANFGNLTQMSQTVDIVNLTTPTGKTLVPVGAVLGINDVNKASYSYIVKTAQEGTISVQAKNITLNNNGNAYSAQNILLFTYTTFKIDDTHQNVVLDFSIKMPENELQYNIIKNGSISLQLVFTIM